MTVTACTGMGAKLEARNPTQVSHPVTRTQFLVSSQDQELEVELMFSDVGHEHLIGVLTARPRASLRRNLKGKTISHSYNN